MTDNSKIVLNFLKEHDGEDLTLKDISAALDMSARQVNGIVVASFQNHKNEDKEKEPLAYREEAIVENEEGKQETVKFIRLTEAGKTFDPDAE